MLFRSEEEEEEDHSDPKAELIRRLQEYKRFKEASIELDQLPRVDRDIFPASARLPEFQLPKAKVNYDKNDLSFALRNILDEMVRLTSHKVTLENISVESKSLQMLQKFTAR